MTRGAVACVSEWRCRGMLGEHASTGQRLDLTLSLSPCLGGVVSSKQLEPAISRLAPPRDHQGACRVWAHPRTECWTPPSMLLAMGRWTLDPMLDAGPMACHHRRFGVGRHAIHDSDSCRG